jgi:predicted 2-oxoglutarate/Fe(II)-dependent dioxygenase YbiX
VDVLASHPRAAELAALAKERSPESQSRLARLLEELGLPGDTFKEAEHSSLPRSDNVLIGEDVCPYEITENVVQIRGAVPFADKLIRQANAIGQWKPSTQVNGEGGSYVNENRTSKWQKITEGAFTGLYTTLCARLWEASQFYRCWNPYAVIQSGGVNWDIVRYDEGDLFGVHVDAIANTRWHTRQLTAMVYLNDDFEGGETQFHAPGPELVVQPEAGKVVLFPPFFTHPHEGRPVTSGTKYIALGWFYS